MSNYEYTVPWVAHFFNSFPHINFTFQEISSKFDPENASYQEALIVWAAIPVLVLVLSLVFFLVFYCCRCFRGSQQDRKPTKGKCFVWTIGIFVLLSCAAIALGFYGNEDVSKGMVEVTTSAESVDDSVQKVLDMSYDLETTLNTTVQRGVGRIALVMDRTIMNSTVRSQLDSLMSHINTKVKKIIQGVTQADNGVKQINVKKYIKGVETGEYYRWMATLIICSWTLAICLLWFIAIGKASKGLLFVCAVLGMLTLTICWTSAGLHNATAVAVGDFCIDPNAFIMNEVAKNNVMEKDVLIYYMACNGSAAPFTQAIAKGTAGLSLVTGYLEEIYNISRHLPNPTALLAAITRVHQGATKSTDLLNQINGVANCVSIHKEYIDAINGVCYSGLGGIALLLLAFVVMGVSFLIMLMMAPFAWRKMGRRRRYIEVDEDDPFLPRSGNSQTASTHSPGYYRYGSVSNRQSYVNPGPTLFSEPGAEPGPLVGRRTPPPAYGEHAESRTMSNRNTFSRSSDVF